MREYPGPLLPGRIVSHVNGVAALEISDPLLFLIVDMKADDSPRPSVGYRHRATAA